MLRHSCGYYLADKGTDLRTMQGTISGTATPGIRPTIPALLGNVSRRPGSRDPKQLNNKAIATEAGEGRITHRQYYPGARALTHRAHAVPATPLGRHAPECVA